MNVLNKLKLNALYPELNDLNIDLKNGKILTILITPKKTPTFLKNKVVTTTLFELSWHSIILIGVDAIFIDIH